VNIYIYSALLFLLLSFVLHVIPAAFFIYKISSRDVASKADGISFPSAMVILCVRGVDPFLEECVNALLSQDYPDYTLKIVVDNENDSAWNIVNDIIKSSGASNVQVISLASKRSTCTLKCSALIQAVSELDRPYFAMAFVDADVIAHTTWLKELVTPLVSQGVDATTGNRWYVPSDSEWGTLIRYFWNSLSVVFMCIEKSLWGGSMAIKVSTIRKAKLIERWSRGASTDALILHSLREVDASVEFVPTAIMKNVIGS
jgi:cellulose synthase/poly-beta-1,6-N-acetylglucosamine synthase-like glycosyltransferase